MSTSLRFLIGCLLCVFAALSVHADDWKLDIVHLKNRERFEGLIVSESKEEVIFKRIVREAGRRRGPC